MQFIFLSFWIIARLSQSRFPISPSSLPSTCSRNTCTQRKNKAQRHTQADTLNCSCGKWRCADCPLRWTVILFVFTFHSLLLFSACAAFSRTASVRCAHIYFLSSLCCLLSSFHPSLISLPSSRTWWRQGSVSRQRT